jgi:mono/diheme cytochrome c family protein
VRYILLLIALAAASPAAAAAPRAPSADPAVERGRDVAQRHCAECHALGPGRGGANGDGPSFAILRLRYNELSLARRIKAVSRGEHGGMPPVMISDTDRRDLIRFVESLAPETP